MGARCGRPGCRAGLTGGAGGRLPAHGRMAVGPSAARGAGAPRLAHEAGRGLGAVHQLVGRDVVADDLAGALAAVVAPVPARAGQRLPLARAHVAAPRHTQCRAVTGGPIAEHVRTTCTGHVGAPTQHGRAAWAPVCHPGGDMHGRSLIHCAS